ncbi:MAG: hypothetical protein K6E54_10845, partial [Bacteroidaceae bacterium]|nr:hypothetical protein [Bacteroidaceae bacterium]
MDKVLMVLGTCVVLPIAVVFIIMYKSKHETDRKTDIVLTALEKNPNVNVESIMTSFSKKANFDKTIKERIVSQLQNGIIMGLIGLGLLSYTFYMDYVGGMSTEILEMFYLGGFIMLAMGIAYLISFFISKKYFAKEMNESEAQEKENVDQIAE